MDEFSLDLIIFLVSFTVTVLSVIRIIMETMISYRESKYSNINKDTLEKRVED